MVGLGEEDRGGGRSNWGVGSGEWGREGGEGGWGGRGVTGGNDMEPYLRARYECHYVGQGTAV